MMFIEIIISDVVSEYALYISLRDVHFAGYIHNTNWPEKLLWLINITDSQYVLCAYLAKMVLWQFWSDVERGLG